MYHQFNQLWQWGKRLSWSRNARQLEDEHCQQQQQAEVADATIPKPLKQPAQVGEPLAATPDDWWQNNSDTQRCTSDLDDLFGTGSDKW